jgi:steroid 5-alpha reductase family enzyme
MVTAWSLRLTVYLARRVAALHPEEDARYQDLRKAWAGRLDLRFFVFFQAQALAAVIFSAPHAIAAVDPTPDLGPLELSGIALWLCGLAGESLADYQLARFKADPGRRGQVCRAGLWNYSRHPNYFFEWLVWCGFAVFALGSPYGALGLVAPALMLYTLLKVTGIPATEEAAVKRRGDAYRAYQRTTSAFVPWFPRKA